MNTRSTPIELNQVDDAMGDRLAPWAVAIMLVAIGVTIWSVFHAMEAPKLPVVVSGNLIQPARPLASGPFGEVVLLDRAKTRYYGIQHDAVPLVDNRGIGVRPASFTSPSPRWRLLAMTYVNTGGIWERGVNGAKMARFIKSLRKRVDAEVWFVRINPAERPQILWDMDFQNECADSQYDKSPRLFTCIDRFFVAEGAGGPVGSAFDAVYLWLNDMFGWRGGYVPLPEGQKLSAAERDAWWTNQKPSGNGFYQAHATRWPQIGLVSPCGKVEAVTGAHLGTVLATLEAAKQQTTCGKGVDNGTR